MFHFGGLITKVFLTHAKFSMNQVTGAAVRFIVTQFYLVMLLSSSVTFVNLGRMRPTSLLLPAHWLEPVTWPCLTAGGLGDTGFPKDTEQAEVSLPRVVRAQTSWLVSWVRV